MPRPRPLTPSEAKRSLANRLGLRVADRLRQFSTRFGLRSRRVFLTWTQFTGAERGEGRERVIARIELLPTPKVADATTVMRMPFAAGVLPVGSLRVSLISVAYTYDQLTGRRIPGRSDDGPIPEPIDFFYELVEDGRGDDPAERQRFRVLGIPWRDEGNVGWSVLLERSSEDFARDGTSQIGIDPDD